ncbi:MAG: KOW domain-containing RNA-binding protein [Ktedonobacteraceae bacterium]
MSMSNRAFEVGDRVRVVGNLFHGEQSATDNSSTTGIVRSVDKDRRRTEPYYIYFIELPGEEKLVDFEFRDLELISPASE